MSEEYISVLSLTDAYKAKQILASQRIKARIVNAPKPDGSGCSYALLLKDSKQAALQLLQQHQMTVS